jgi:hypothetical protein
MVGDWNYSSGDWLIICDVCGEKIKASESKKRWDGLIVCSKDYEERHSMDFLRGRKERVSVPFTRPRTTDVFVYLPENSERQINGNMVNELGIN